MSFTPREISNGSDSNSLAPRIPRQSSEDKSATPMNMMEGLMEKLSFSPERKQPHRMAKNGAIRRTRIVTKDASSLSAAACLLQPELCFQEIFRAGAIDDMTPSEVHQLKGKGEVIGQGAFGIVFKVSYKNRAAAFKESTLDLLREAFENELEILKFLDGAGGAPIPLAFSRKPCGIVMELCSGVPLHKFLRHPDVSADDKLKVFPEIAKMLHEIHLKGVVHKDIKADNIMVELQAELRTPRVRIIDFGISCKLTSPSHQRKYISKDVKRFGRMLISTYKNRRFAMPKELHEVGEAACRTECQANLPQIIRDLNWHLEVYSIQKNIHV